MSGWAQRGPPVITHYNLYRNIELNGLPSMAWDPDAMVKRLHVIADLGRDTDPFMLHITRRSPRKSGA